MTSGAQNFDLSGRIVEELPGAGGGGGIGVGVGLGKERPNSAGLKGRVTQDFSASDKRRAHHLSTADLADSS